MKNMMVYLLAGVFYAWYNANATKKQVVSNWAVQQRYFLIAHKIPNEWKISFSNHRFQSWAALLHITFKSRNRLFKMKIAELELKSLTELRKIGEELGIPDALKRKKEFLMISLQSDSGRRQRRRSGKSGERWRRTRDHAWRDWFSAWELSDEQERYLCLTGTAAPIRLEKWWSCFW